MIRLTFEIDETKVKASKILRKILPDVDAAVADALDPDVMSSGGAIDIKEMQDFITYSVVDIDEEET